MINAYLLISSRSKNPETDVNMLCVDFREQLNPRQISHIDDLTKIENVIKFNSLGALHACTIFGNRILGYHSFTKL